MTTTRTPKAPSPAWRYVGRYGPMAVIGDDPDFGLIYGPVQEGIPSDFLGDAGLEAHVIADGRLIVAIDGKVVPVLCSEVISVVTEDGPGTGRCGEVLRGDVYACPGHTAEIESWLALTEADKAMWERARDEYGPLGPHGGMPYGAFDRGYRA
jgi:hypothetical protein